VGELSEKQGKGGKERGGFAGGQKGVRYIGVLTLSIPGVKFRSGIFIFILFIRIDKTVLT